MSEPTTIFSIYDDKDREIRAVLTEVYRALKEKGYNPINQLVGYILSEDPTYITTYQGARSLIFMQVLTSKEENGVQVADRIHVTLLSTDTTKSPIERMKKQSDKNGLWSALEIGTIWLEKSLLDAKKEEKK